MSTQRFLRTITVAGEEYSYYIATNARDEFFFQDITTPRGPFGPGVSVPEAVLRDIHSTMQAIKVSTMDIEDLIVLYSGLSGISG